jgi:hypothetical protein
MESDTQQIALGLRQGETVQTKHEILIFLYFKGSVRIFR